jgi:uncharacterized protein DUF4197
MSFDDARKILTGGDTAATDYFKRTSSVDLTATFTPILLSSPYWGGSTVSLSTGA